MLFVLSPAKSLDYETPLNGQPHTAPLFVKQSKELITLLRDYSPQDIASLMDLSDKLSTLNVARYAAGKGVSSGSREWASIIRERAAMLVPHVEVLSGREGTAVFSKSFVVKELYDALNNNEAEFSTLD